MMPDVTNWSLKRGTCDNFEWSLVTLERWWLLLRGRCNSVCIAETVINERWSLFRGVGNERDYCTTVAQCFSDGIQTWGSTCRKTT